MPQRQMIRVSFPQMTGSVLEKNKSLFIQCERKFTKTLALRGKKKRGDLKSCSRNSCCSVERRLFEWNRNIHPIKYLQVSACWGCFRLRAQRIMYEFQRVAWILPLMKDPWDPAYLMQGCENASVYELIWKIHTHKLLIQFIHFAEKWTFIVRSEPGHVASLL